MLESVFFFKNFKPLVLAIRSVKGKVFSVGNVELSIPRPSSSSIYA